ncbi:putative bifunctional diguanylate cyclase/phosphodiesterase [Krasilnikovia sp. M28-CT-15]|uniref:putative bifunctional diguanylate cyclase/phosphodiesterase n=1 Tax=Krasilnikovia sp. M28-CT-15 TaxID=3373540 RepID=UPI0038773806
MIASSALAQAVRPGAPGSGGRRSGRPRAVRVWTAAVVATALVVAVLAALLPVHRPPGAPFTPVTGTVLAAAAVAAGQLTRLRFRLGGAVVSLSWGEAAMVVGYAVAPTGRLPAAVFVGAASAWALMSWLDDHRRHIEILHLAGSLTLGAAAGAAVTTAVAGSAGLQTARFQAALVAGAFCYLAVTFALAVLTLALRRDAPARQLVARALHAKAPMAVGNVVVGLAAVFVLVRGPIWLLSFAPALWLLQRTYRYHLRAAQERRIWAAFARATAALPGASEAEVAHAGIDGALDVFDARRVEIEVHLPEGGHRRYTGDGPGPEVVADGLPGPVITRSMAVAGIPVGELTVWLAEPTLPAGRDELAVSAYGDALAGALHGAAGRERLTALEARAAYEAVRDPLTGLTNRAALLAETNALLRTVDRDRHVALLLLDLNDFREVNATLGYRAGDDVLRVVAQRMLDLAREDDVVARLGDDEFAVLLPTVSTPSDAATPLHEAPPPLSQALRRARELVEQLAAPMVVGGVRLAVEGAVGVAVATAGSADLAELLRRAAVALKQAKQLRVGVATYDSSRDASSTDHLALLAELRDALTADDQIVLALQPAVDLASGAPVGVEALTRWRHPRRGPLTPAAFIAAVEHSELLGPFTRYMLDRSLAAAAGWIAADIDVPVSVNVSARSLLDPTFPSQVADALRRHVVPARHLVLEITETVAISDLEIVDEVLAALRETGVQLSVDDFGTGFSSLAFLTRVAIDELKVDRSFVDEMIDSPAAEAVVRGAVELGGRLHARVVAEGVETAEQRAALLALGCVSAQGYHFCQPMPPDKIVGTLHRLGEAATQAKIVPLRADDAS